MSDNRDRLLGDRGAGLGSLHEDLCVWLRGMRDGGRNWMLLWVHRIVGLGSLREELCVWLSGMRDGV